MARRRLQAGNVERFLDGDRHAMQRPEPGILLASRAVRGACRLQRAVAIDDHQGVDRPVQPCDALQVHLGRLD
ncbi:MAG: hypothetical protein A3D94_12225 [Alphaproteobacteria bacterium RIFCSPHIGHO2_12_FULL_66_14]|nr:MAG: hypothetical protein A3D94_12225 [Alphaproteobacteria bacterium RIFCSPHIGHO2_12_FULL_66_14]